MNSGKRFVDIRVLRKARDAIAHGQERLMARFWSKVDRGGPGECWPWKGATVKNRRGLRYGKFRLAGKSVLAHRFALARRAMSSVPQALHSCDNTLCCNPAHLRSGTQSENMREARDKGRLTILDRRNAANGRFLKTGAT